MHGIKSIYFICKVKMLIAINIKIINTNSYLYTKGNSLSLYV